MNFFTIYILKLEKGKWYVGKTKNLKERLREHFSSSCSCSFTAKYKPLALHESIENCDEFDEEKYTLKYMQKYGINNVRGGPYATIFLQKDAISHIEKSLSASSDRCYKCGEKGHFAKDCDILEEDDVEEEITCFNCGLKGHLSTECYSKRKKDTITCFNCGLKGHLSTECYRKKPVITCFNCGLKGHLSTECYRR
jgi:predicted GIY-YIG superfamily endonuclease